MDKLRSGSRVPLRSGNQVESFRMRRIIMRGLRIKIGVDVGRPSPDINAETGMVHGRFAPCIINMLTRAINAAGMILIQMTFVVGSQHCTSLQVSRLTGQEGGRGGHSHAGVTCIAFCMQYHVTPHQASHLSCTCR